VKPRPSLLVTGIGLLAAYEVLTHLDDDDPTISQHIWRACARYGPVVPFMFGLAAGHLFWQAKR
jgi:hypothetical protein